MNCFTIQHAAQRYLTELTYNIAYEESCPYWENDVIKAVLMDYDKRHRTDFYGNYLAHCHRPNVILIQKGNMMKDCAVKLKCHTSDEKHLTPKICKCDFPITEEILKERFVDYLHINGVEDTEITEKYNLLNYDEA